MGCDIHCFVEVKLNGLWRLYNQPEINRNYRLFEKMAGVRGDVRSAIVAPRGTPLDISEVTQVECERFGEDGHSHSWLNGEEISNIEDWARRNTDLHNNAPFGYISGNGFTDESIFKTSPYQDVRLVFWFDN